MNEEEIKIALQEIYQRIEILREQKGWTLTELEQKSHLPHGKLKKCYCGTDELRLNDLLILSQKLDVSAGYLFSGQNKRIKSE